jgi:hypothetical protein
MSQLHDSLTIRIVRKFLESNLSMVFILVSIAAGVVALVVTPREEEPQIIVAAANVLVSFPGHTAQDVEQLVSTPLEKMLLQIPGVEYVYSRSMPGQSIVTVRFYVGQPLELSYVKLIRKLNENIDRTATTCEDNLAGVASEESSHLRPRLLNGFPCGLPRPVIARRIAERRIQHRPHSGNNLWCHGRAHIEIKIDAHTRLVCHNPLTTRSPLTADCAECAPGSIVQRSASDT